MIREVPKYQLHVIERADGWFEWKIRAHERVFVAKSGLLFRTRTEAERDGRLAYSHWFAEDRHGGR